MPYAKRLQTELTDCGHQCVMVHSHRELEKGDVAFFLSCERIVPQESRAKHCNNLVVHESALPQGKGWSPLTWQILEGKNRIPVTLFEAAEKVDAGKVFAQTFLDFDGHELIDEMRIKLGNKIIEMCLAFVHSYPNVEGTEQSGPESFYPRRGPKDSQLDPNVSIESQFNLLRIVDNNRYPAHFYHLGKKYLVKIEKAD